MSAQIGQRCTDRGRLCHALNAAQAARLRALPWMGVDLVACRAVPASGIPIASRGFPATGGDIDPKQWPATVTTECERRGKGIAMRLTGLETSILAVIVGAIIGFVPSYLMEMRRER